MSDYKSFTHVVRLGKPEVDGILDGAVRVFAKIDGTNACIYAKDGVVHYGSRKREVSTEDDNANFATYMTSTDDAEVAALRQYVLDHENYIVYGEWLAGVNGYKFTGALKGYTEGGFVVFAVYDVDKDEYLDYEDYYDDITSFYHLVVPCIAHLDHPTEDDLVKLLDKTDYLRPEGNAGEGIVIYRDGNFRDTYGNIHIAKIVRQEFLDSKSRKSKAREAIAAGENEREFVETFVTNSEISKAQAKIMAQMGIDEWKNDKGLIGRTMNEVVTSVIQEEFADWIIKKKMKCSIDFGMLRNMIQGKVREYLGL